MNSSKAILAISFVLLISGCKSKEPGTVIRIGSPELSKLMEHKSGFVILSDEEYLKLKEDSENRNSLGRFKIFQNGSRTWRLDTATGRTCLLLASEEDWKKLTVSACNLEDLELMNERDQNKKPPTLGGFFRNGTLILYSCDNPG